MDDALVAELNVLLRLLDDPDETVQHSVEDRLREIGSPARTYLRDIAQQAPPELRRQILETLRTVHLATLERAWYGLLESPSVDLEEGAFLLARYGYPDLDPVPYIARLDTYALRFRDRHPSSEGVDQAALLGVYLCEELGFTGNQEAYYDSRNSYLNWVLDHRRGIPISLSVVYLLLGQRLGMPVYGVNMPAHFLVKYEAEKELFFDLYHGATPLTREECQQLLVKSEVEPRSAFFAATDERTILLRMARNLHYVAHLYSNTTMIADFARLLGPES